MVKRWPWRGRGGQRREVPDPCSSTRGIAKTVRCGRDHPRVDLAIPTGERHAVIGPNGAGKSTLFHLISGHYRPSGGVIRLRGEEIGGMAPQLINRRGLSRSFQVTNIFPHLNVWENVRCATLWAMGYKYSFWRNVERLADARQRTEEILTEINLLDRWRMPAGVLTYAEQRSLEIGLAIAGNADILLLDEPTAGMSHAETERVVSLIRRVSEKRTLLMIEHDMGSRVRSRRPNLGIGLRRDHRFRHTRAH